MNKKLLGLAALAAFGLGVGGVASATQVTMSFDELATTGNGGQYVADYYNGGCGVSYHGGPVSCGGPDYGVVWAGASVAEGGLYGQHAPTTPNILFRGTENNTTGPVVTMNVANGFTSGFSFYYSSTIGATSPIAPDVTFYSGLDGTGDILGTTGSLAPTPRVCDGVAGLFPCWNFVDGLTFSGVVRSAVFNGPTNGLAWDAVSFDMRPAVTGVPEPAALGLFGLGALMLAFFAGLRRRFN